MLDCALLATLSFRSGDMRLFSKVRVPFNLTLLNGMNLTVQRQTLISFPYT